MKKIRKNRELVLILILENDQESFSSIHKVKEHESSKYENALQASLTGIAQTFGVYYQNSTKVCYDDIHENTLKNTPQKDPNTLLDAFVI